jgi:hypothetical protein
VQKLREVFVLQPVLRKNLSRFLKSIFIFPESVLKEDIVKQAKNGKKLKKRFFFVIGGIPDPP